MSEEVRGGQGQIFGSMAYFAALHQGRLLGEILPSLSSCDYPGAIRDLGARASGVLQEIYAELNSHREILAYLSERRRGRLLTLLGELEEICRLDGGGEQTASLCEALLAAGAYSASVASEHERSAAGELLGGGGKSGLNPFERLTALQEAASWGMLFASGGDRAKELFLEELTSINSAPTFLQDVWSEYHYREAPSEYCGQNGCEFCTESYVGCLGEQVFPGGIPEHLAGQIREELREIFREIEADVFRAHGGNYVREMRTARA